MGNWVVWLAFSLLEKREREERESRERKQRERGREGGSFRGVRIGTALRGELQVKKKRSVENVWWRRGKVIQTSHISLEPI